MLPSWGQVTNSLLGYIDCNLQITLQWFHNMCIFLKGLLFKASLISPGCCVIVAWLFLILDLSQMFPHAFWVHVCSVPEWRGLTCQIWPKWAASYFSESNERHFWHWKLQAREIEIVRDWNRMKIYLPIARFGACLHVCHAASEKRVTFSRIRSVTLLKRCAQFAFQMRREERKSAPLGVMLYIWTCVAMWVRQEQCFVFLMRWYVWTV